MMERMSKEQMLNRINQLSFAVVEMTLYLDINPCDEEALAYFEEKSALRNEALEAYAKKLWPAYHRYRQRYQIPQLGMGESAVALGSKKRRMPLICGIMKKDWNIR